MLVQCPNCRTNYKVADEVVKGSAPAFRCSRCKHTFELDSDTAPAQASTKPARPEETSKSEDQEHFAFSPAPPVKETIADEPPAPEPIAAAPAVAKPTSQSEFGPRSSLREPVARADNSLTATKASAPEQPEQISAATDNLPASEPEVPTVEAAPEPESSVNILTMASYVDQRASIRPYLSLFGLLLIGFCLLAALTYGQPLATEQIIKNIPLVGTSILKNNHLKEKILLQSLQSGYQTIQANRVVLVISGVALNHNPVVIREVKLTGKLFNDESKEVEQQTIWVGNTISPKIIRGMTSEDIPHLQELKPLKNFELPPGDSIPFTLVFLKPAKNAKEFTLEVILADGDL